jgi:hypothetical protein
MLNAAAVNHTCFCHQPLSCRRLRRSSRANAFLRGLNSLGSRVLRSSIDQPRSAVRDLARAPLRRSRQFPLTLGSGSDHPAVLTAKCMQLHFGMSWMRFDCRKKGLLAADGACFRDDVLNPHLISFRPGSGGEGDGRPLLLYEAEIEPGRLVMAARSIAVCASR